MTNQLSEGTGTNAPPEVTALLDRLADPKVASGLHNLLDHVDLLAILLIGLDGFVARSEMLGEALSESLTDIRAVAGENESMDVAAMASSVVSLASTLPKITPALTQLVDEGAIDAVVESGVISSESLAQIGMLANAVNRGAARAQTSPLNVTGPMALYKQMKDPDIARGLGFTLSILKEVGRELDGNSK